MADAPIFVDTGYFVALLNRRDDLHERARQLAEGFAKDERRLLTTDAVLVELANFFARSPLRTLAISSIQRLRSAPGWTIDHVTPPCLARAITRYAAHPDKHWSLTDCVSMEVMLDHNAIEAATPDHHFTQAGFRVLMQGTST